MNKAILIGNIGRDPEVRTTQSGDKVANLALATSERWKDKQTGERKERTEWHRVTVWGPLAGVCEQYIRKGAKVAITGRIETRKWQDQSGQDRYTTECVLQKFRGELQLLDKREGGERQTDQQQGLYDRDDERTHGGGAVPDLDDEIPFAPEWR